MTGVKYNISAEDEQRTVSVYRIKNDVNGHPRFVIHWLDLGLKDYVSDKKTKAAWLRLYKGKEFGGGFVFTTYKVEDFLERALEILHSKKYEVTEAL